MKIYVIGDSHTCNYLNENKLAQINNWNINDCFNIMHLGPLTAYNISNKPEVVSYLSQVEEGSYYILSFGEIDCRCRVLRKDAPDENLEKILNLYFDFIKTIKNKNLILTNLTPCLLEEPSKEFFDSDPKNREVWHATSGTLSERNEVKNKFNIRLKQFCEEQNFIYIDFWDDVFQKKDFYMDDIHLNGSLVNGIIKTKIFEKIK